MTCVRWTVVVDSAAQRRLMICIAGPTKGWTYFYMRRLLLLLFALGWSTALWADATLFVQEPYGVL